MRRELYRNLEKSTGLNLFGFKYEYNRDSRGNMKKNVPTINFPFSVYEARERFLININYNLSQSMTQSAKFLPKIAKQFERKAYFFCKRTKEKKGEKIEKR